MQQELSILTSMITAMTVVKAIGRSNSPGGHGIGAGYNHGRGHGPGYNHGRSRHHDDNGNNGNGCCHKKRNSFDLNKNYRYCQAIGRDMGYCG